MTGRCWHSLLCLSLLFCVSLASIQDGDENERFLVIRATVQTERQLDMIRDLHDNMHNYDLDFWLTPKAVSHLSDIMVRESKKKWLEKRLDEYEITHFVSIPDVLKLILERERPKNVSIENEEVLKFSRRFHSEGGNKAKIRFAEYHDYNTIVEWMENIQRLYPDKAKVITIGTTFEGRPIKTIKIGRDVQRTDKRIFWIDSGIHAREWASVHTSLYFIDRLIADYDSDPLIHQAVDLIHFYITPVLNPDGYEYTRSGVTPTIRLWRKNRAKITCRKDAWFRDKCCGGVDLNRNFDWFWGETGSSFDRCSEIYAGHEAFSENETRAVRDMMFSPELKGKVDGFITMHTYSQMFIHPFSHQRRTVPEDIADIEDVGQRAVNALTGTYGTQYRFGTAADILYPSAGGSDDWAKGKGGAKYVYLIELRPSDEVWDGFILDSQQLIPTGKETWNGVKVVIQAVLDRLRREAQNPQEELSLAPANISIGDDFNPGIDPAGRTFSLTAHTNDIHNITKHPHYQRFVNNYFERFPTTTTSTTTTTTTTTSSATTEFDDESSEEDTSPTSTTTRRTSTHISTHRTSTQRPLVTMPVTTPAPKLYGLAGVWQSIKDTLYDWTGIRIRRSIEFDFFDDDDEENEEVLPIPDVASVSVLPVSGRNDITDSAETFFESRTAHLDSLTSSGLSQQFGDSVDISAPGMNRSSPMKPSRPPPPPPVRTSSKPKAIAARPRPVAPRPAAPPPVFTPRPAPPPNRNTFPPRPTPVYQGTNKSIHMGVDGEIRHSQLRLDSLRRRLEERQRLRQQQVTQQKQALQETFARQQQLAALKPHRDDPKADFVKSDRDELETTTTAPTETTTAETDTDVVSVDHETESSRSEASSALEIVTPTVPPTTTTSPSAPQSTETPIAMNESIRSTPVQQLPNANLAQPRQQQFAQPPPSRVLQQTVTSPSVIVQPQEEKQGQLPAQLSQQGNLPVQSPSANTRVVNPFVATEQAFAANRFQAQQPNQSVQSRPQPVTAQTVQPLVPTQRPLARLTPVLQRPAASVPSGVCADRSPWCAAWLANNPRVCVISSIYMRRDCPRTCRFCA